MDINQIISSGVLEQYVLDQLSPVERREVEGYALKYPEIKAELDNIETALFVFSKAAAVTPRAGLEAEIIKNVASTDAPGFQSERNTSTLMAALAIISLIIAALAGWLFFQKSNALEAARTEHNIVLDDCAENEARLNQLEGMIDQLLENGAALIKMQGTDLQPDAYANVIYNVDKKSTLLETANLPVPASDKQYQLWAIVDGAPVDLGVFDISQDTVLLPVQFVENAQAFAVTLEPRGGSEAPTMEQMYVIGNTNS